MSSDLGTLARSCTHARSMCEATRKTQHAHTTAQSQNLWRWRFKIEFGGQKTAEVRSWPRSETAERQDDRGLRMISVWAAHRGRCPSPPSSTP